MSKGIFESWIFDHEQYAKASDALVDEIERAIEGGAPFVFPVLGDSRCGKSALLKDIETLFANRLSASGHKKVIYVPMPAAASNEALATRIIQTIIGDIQVKGKISEILDQASKAMTRSGTVVILVDESNHLVERRSTSRAQTKDNRRTADWFKELGDLFGISVVIAGLSHVSRIYTDNDQLANRGLTGVTLLPYSWGVEHDRRQFQDTLTAGLVHLKENGWDIQVEYDRIVQVIYYGGGGYIGKAMDFLARIEVIGRKQKCLDSALLTRAYQDKYQIGSHGNPVDFKGFDTVLLQRAHKDAIARASRNGGRGN